MLLGTFLTLTSSLFSIALAGPYKPYEKATPLEINLVGPGDYVNSVDDFIISATVKNTGRESVNVFRYGSILDSEFPTQSFNVTKDGVAVNFTGVKAFPSSKLESLAIATIPAGGSVTVKHKVAGLYDFQSAGTGNYSFEPLSNIFVAMHHSLNTTKYPAAVATFSIEATTNVVHIQVLVTDNIASRKITRVDLNRRAINATNKCEDSERKRKIQQSYDEAKTLAQVARDYLTIKPNDALVSTYFGLAARPSVIASIFDRAFREDDNERSLHCNDPINDCNTPNSEGLLPIAYTLSSGHRDIHYCPIFFTNNYPSTDSLCTGTTVDSRSVQGGITLHELTHATSALLDIKGGVGCEASRNLAEHLKEWNADNYNCFATEIYKITKCKYPRPV